MPQKEPAGGNNPNKMSRSALRRQREREHRNRTILRAAESLFSETGYHSTSIEQIADEAEVSVGTVYFYFKNKEDLLVKLMVEIGYELRSLLGREFEKNGTSLKGIENAGFAFFEEFCRLQPGRLAILYRESVGQSELVEQRRKDIFKKLTGDIQAAMSRIGDAQKWKYESALSIEVVAVSIMGLFERIAYHYLLWQHRPQDLKIIGRDVVDFILGGIENLNKRSKQSKQRGN